MRGASSGRTTLSPHELQALFERDPDRAERTARLLGALGYVDRFWRFSEREATEAERTVWNEHWALAPGAGAMTLRPLFECIWQEHAPGAAATGPAFDTAAIDRPLMGQPVAQARVG